MKPDGIDEEKKEATASGPDGSDRGKPERSSLVKNVLLAATGQGARKAPDEAALEEAERRAETWAKEAIRASQALGLEISGADLMLDAHGPARVIEVNYSPGFKGIEAATGVDIASRIIQYVTQTCGGAP